MFFSPHASLFTVQGILSVENHWLLLSFKKFHRFAIVKDNQIHDEQIINV